MKTTGLLLESIDVQPEMAAIWDHWDFSLAAANSTPGMMGFWTQALRCVFANSGYLAWFGHTKESMIGIHMRDVLGQALFDTFEPHARAALRGENQQFERAITKPDGEIGWHWIQYCPHRVNGEVIGFFSSLTDISLLKRNQERLRVSDAALNAVSQGVIVIDLDSRVLYVNEAFEHITGRDKTASLGQDCCFLQGPLTEPKMLEAIRASLIENTEFSGEMLNYRKDGSSFWSEVTVSPVHDRLGNTTHHVATFTDVSSRKAMEQQVRQLAFYDALTQLPNRRLFDDRLSQAMASSKRSGGYGALMFLDLDNFKPLNDHYGHVVGDLLLAEVAQRLKHSVREIDTVARFGGDEFVVMLVDLSPDKEQAQAEAQAVAEKLRIKLAEPYVLAINRHGGPDDSIVHRCTASIGVALFINNGPSQDDIVKWADSAMYQAKEGGRNRVQFFDPPTSGSV